MGLRAAVMIGVLLFACGAALGWFAGTPWFGGVRGTVYAGGIAEDYALGLFLSTAGSLLTIGAGLVICALSFRRSFSRAARTSS